MLSKPERLSETLAVAMNDTRRTDNAQLALLHRTSRIVSSGVSLDRMLEEIIAIAVEVTACDACLLYLPDISSDHVVLCASQLPHSAEIGKVHLRMGEGVTGWVAQHREAVALSQRASSDERFRSFSSLIEDTYEALLSVPLVTGGVVIGVLNVHHKSPHDHTPDEIALLSFVGEQMGNAIAISRLAAANAELQQQAVEMRQQLADKKAIANAKRILQRKYCLTEEQAYERMRTESRRLRRPMRELAEAILLVEGLASHSAVTPTRPASSDSL